VQGRDSLDPHQRRRNQLEPAKPLEPDGVRGRGDPDVCVYDELQRRDSATAATQFGAGVPSSSFCHSGGSGSIGYISSRTSRAHPQMAALPKPLRNNRKLRQNARCPSLPFDRRIPSIHAGFRRKAPSQQRASGAEGRVFESRRARGWIPCNGADSRLRGARRALAARLEIRPRLPFPLPFRAPDTPNSAVLGPKTPLSAEMTQAFVRTVRSRISRKGWRPRRLAVT
jgi:hypothetical protein